MATWLITGATGFLGRYVPDALGEGLGASGVTEATIVVVGRRRPEGWPESRFFQADLEEPESLRQAVEGIRPDHVIHTAGKTPPATDEALYKGNFWMTIRLLNALRALKKPVRVTLAGSAAELGPVPTAALPVAETHRCDPITAYGRSKWMASVAGLAEEPPLEVNVARVFNPIGPGQPPGSAFGGFAAQLRSPTADPLVLVAGELEARRDFLDVRDAARALVAIALHGKGGEAYHVGTGESRTVREGLERLIALSGRTASVCLDSTGRDRKGPMDSRADIGKIIGETGWAPRIPFEQSLADLWAESSSQAGLLEGRVSTRLPLTA